MGIEFSIGKDIATISATITELAATNSIICDEIGADDFRREYESLLLDVINSYRGVVDILQPLTALAVTEDFQQHFDALAQSYNESYQSALSQPRVNAEFTFEKYLQFRKRKEVHTGYPPLKRSFSRLHDFIDKWIDNDIWLAMTIDSLLKLLYRLLGDIAELKKVDNEAAFQLYQSSVGGLSPFLQIIEDQLRVIEETRRYSDAGTNPLPATA